MKNLHFTTDSLIVAASEDSAKCCIAIRYNGNFLRDIILYDDAIDTIRKCLENVVKFKDAGFTISSDAEILRTDMTSTLYRCSIHVYERKDGVIMLTVLDHETDELCILDLADLFEKEKIEDVIEFLRLLTW